MPSKLLKQCKRVKLYKNKRWKQWILQKSTVTLLVQMEINLMIKFKDRLILI